MGLIRRCVGGVELNCCGGKRSGKISNGCLGLAALTDWRRLCAVSASRQVERSLGIFVIYFDEFCRRSGLFERSATTTATA